MFHRLMSRDSLFKEAVRIYAVYNNITNQSDVFEYKELKIPLLLLDINHKNEVGDKIEFYNALKRVEYKTSFETICKW